MYNGQAQQDKFVLNVLKEKRNGYFVEIGSNDTIEIHNTYLLESKYGWKGIMVDYEDKYLPLYKIHRPNSIHIINDATKINYRELFETAAFPSNLDYLQIDLEATNNSTIDTLIKMDKEVFDKYKFATITFEHDIYQSYMNKTRPLSREIFEKRGYVRVFSDIHNHDILYPYEDWYVHPDLVDMDYINRLVKINEKHYRNHSLTGKSIDWYDIEYNV